MLSMITSFNWRDSQLHFEMDFREFILHHPAHPQQLNPNTKYNKSNNYYNKGSLHKQPLNMWATLLWSTKKKKKIIKVLLQHV